MASTLLESNMPISSLPKLGHELECGGRVLVRLAEPVGVLTPAQRVDDEADKTVPIR